MTSEHKHRPNSNTTHDAIDRDEGGLQSNGAVYANAPGESAAPARACSPQNGRDDIASVPDAGTDAAAVTNSQPGAPYCVLREREKIFYILTAHLDLVKFVDRKNRDSSAELPKVETSTASAKVAPVREPITMADNIEHSNMYVCYLIYGTKSKRVPCVC